MLIDTEYHNILLNTKTNENDMQKFLELNTQYIPLPYLLNHGLHFNIVLSKFPISPSYICDFAYITKSTVEWNVVFIEIENPQKRIFLKDNKNIGFTSVFNRAYEQVMSWKVYNENNKDSIKKALNLLFRPSNMSANTLNFKYVLILGSNEEVCKTQIHLDMFREKSSDDIRVMTYDSIYNFKKERNSVKHILMSKEKEQYRIKNLDSTDTSLFSFLNNNELIIEEKDIDLLRTNNFEIDKWLAGEYLTINHKYASSSTKTLMKGSLNKKL